MGATGNYLTLSPPFQKRGGERQGRDVSKQVQILYAGDRAIIWWSVNPSGVGSLRPGDRSIGRLTTLGAKLTEALSVNSSTMTAARKGLPVSFGEDGGN